jgi:hypothetical protein
MARKHKTGLGAAFYVPKKKKRFMEATSATARFLGIVCEENPELTIQEIRDLITDKTQYIYNPEAVAVLDAHIKKGYGKCIPNWTYKGVGADPRRAKNE